MEAPTQKREHTGRKMSKLRTKELCRQHDMQCITVARCQMSLSL